jgi:hypothetical protein
LDGKKMFENYYQQLKGILQEILQELRYVREYLKKNQPQTERDNTAPAQWRYLALPVSENERDTHDEYYSESINSPDGLKLIGARVRGKMHKHNGTNCDDWFKFDVSGKWTIIAVSDGAGSKEFSRIGAKESCKAAVNHLANKLKSHQIKERNTTNELSGDTKRDSNWTFVGEDIEYCQLALHEAIEFAHSAVKEKVNECGQISSYSKALGGRDIEIKDLSATLLLAIHTTIKVGETEYSLILTCQVGDGIIAAISQEGKLQLLGKPDIGSHAGQTEFLTSKNKIDRQNLIQKTFVFAGHLKALMVMTDGVSDTYFPNDPKMLELYGDLVLNHVIHIPKSNNKEVGEKWKSTILEIISSFKSTNKIYQHEVERIIPDDSNEPKKVRLYSVTKYNQDLSKYIAENFVDFPTLSEADSLELMCDECHKMKSDEKLKLWLDSYHQKGAFDDRTLVILCREDI